MPLLALLFAVATSSAQLKDFELALAPPISGSPTAAQIGGELSAVSEALKSGNGELLGRSLGNALQLLDELDGEVTRRRKLPPPRLSAPPLATESGPPSAAPSPAPAAITPQPPQQPGQQPQFQTVPLPGQAAPIAEPAPGR